MSLIFDLFRFVDEHHRNIIYDLVYKLAFFAYQPFFFLLQQYGSFTLGTGQYFQQIFIYHFLFSHNFFIDVALLYNKLVDLLGLPC